MVGLKDLNGKNLLKDPNGFEQRLVTRLNTITQNYPLLHFLTGSSA